ncbi:MAG TPA: rod shape-determining protein MreC [Dehalococcoidia bacterium]|nr:rod shape-determining protein MreC [Dehalococcoidia bacterium]
MLSQRGVLDSFQNLGLRLTSPITGTVEGVAEVLSGNSGPAQSELEAEIERLNAELAALRERAADAATLEEMLGFTQNDATHTTIGARVFQHQPQNFEDNLAIDRGSNDGLAEGMVVLSPQGSLVGRITRVFPDYSWVRVITDQSSNINAEIPAAQIDGALTSNGDGNLTLELVPKERDVSEGDQVVTSTQSILYPPGLLVGLVISVSDTDELFKRIIIEPSAPLANLDSVLVITSFEPRELEPPE